MYERMVSCGRDNVRLWRVKEGQLRSAPVNLGEYHLMEFTDVCFEAGYHADKDPAERIVWVTCIYMLSLCLYFSNEIPWKSWKWVTTNYHFETESIQLWTLRRLQYKMFPWLKKYLQHKSHYVFNSFSVYTCTNKAQTLHIVFFISCLPVMHVVRQGMCLK